MILPLYHPMYVTNNKELKKQRIYISQIPRKPKVQTKIELQSDPKEPLKVNHGNFITNKLLRKLAKTSKERIKTRERKVKYTKIKL